MRRGAFTAPDGGGVKDEPAGPRRSESASRQAGNLERPPAHSLLKHGLSDNNTSLVSPRVGAHVCASARAPSVQKSRPTRNMLYADDLHSIILYY